MSCDNTEIAIDLDICSNSVDQHKERKDKVDSSSRKFKLRKINQAQNEGYQALDNGSIESLRAILKEYPNLLDTKDLSAGQSRSSRHHKPRETLCFYAVESLLREKFDQNNPMFHKKLEILKFVISNAKAKFSDENGNSILHYTAKCRCIDGEINKSLAVLKILLNPENAYIRIKIRMQNKEGLTPLAIAFRINDLEKADLLLKNGADLFYWLPENKSFIHDLISNSTSDKATAEYLSKLLIEYKANYTLSELKNAILLPKEESVLAMAASKGYVECLKVFLQYISVNEVLQNGKTLLHLAVEGRNIALISFLLTQKADPNIVNAEGLTPLDVNKLREESKEYVEIVRSLKLAGAVEVNVPTYDVPPELKKLIENLSHEEKLKMENLPRLTEEDEKQLVEDRKVVDEIFNKLNIENHCYTKPEDVKRIIESHPDYYSFVEPLQPGPSTTLFDILCYKELDQQQLQMLEELQSKINDFTKWVKKQLRGLPEPDKYMFARNQEEIDSLLKSERASLFFGTKWFGEQRSVLCFEDLTELQKRYLHKFQREFDSDSEVLMLEWQKATQVLEPHLVQAKTFYLDQYPGEINHVESFKKEMRKKKITQFFCLKSPLYSSLYQEVTLFQKLSMSNQAVLDKIQAPFKSVLAKNRLGYDLLYFCMERSLKNVTVHELKTRIAIEVKEEEKVLNEFTKKMQNYQFEDEKQKKEIEDFIQTWKISLTTLKHRKLERLISLYDLNSKKAGLTQFSQFLRQCEANHQCQTFKIGKHKLKCLDLRKEDYLFFTNTMPATPDRLAELAKHGIPLFFQNTPLISASIVDKITKGFAFGHNDLYLFPLLMVISASLESLAYIGPTDLGSPWGCTALSKLASIKSYESLRFIMDCLLARFQLAKINVGNASHSSSNSRADSVPYSVPQCPAFVLPALRAHAESVITRESAKEKANIEMKDDSKLASEMQDNQDANEMEEKSKKEKKHKVPYYKVPEPSTEDDMADMQKENSRYPGSMPLHPLTSMLKLARYDAYKKDAYIEAIVKCNVLNPAHAKINVKLLAVDEHYFNEFLKDYRENSDKWDEEQRQSIELSLYYLSNISKLTNGKIKFALIKTDMEGWKSKYPVLQQLKSISQEIQQLRPVLLKGALQFARFQCVQFSYGLGLQPINLTEIPKTLNEEFEQARQKYQTMKTQCLEFEQLVHGVKRTEKPPILLSLSDNRVRSKVTSKTQTESLFSETPQWQYLNLGLNKKS